MTQSMTTRPQCPECELYLIEGKEHECGVPILTEAIGLELTPYEKRIIHWLAGCELEAVKAIAGLFGRKDQQLRELAEAVREYEESGIYSRSQVRRELWWKVLQLTERVLGPTNEWLQKKNAEGGQCPKCRGWKTYRDGERCEECNGTGETNPGRGA